MLALFVLALSGVTAGAAGEEKRLPGAALIDQHLKAKWTEAGVTPARRTDDAEFMRRAYLDIAGTVPSLEEAEKFLADRAGDKRSKLVDALLKDPRYADHWADIWSGILVGFDATDRRYALMREQFAKSVRELLWKNVAYDDFARRIITATGETSYGQGKGPMMAEPGSIGVSGYLIKLQREAGRDFPLALAGKLSRAFMGIQIQCAQCHDHPFDKWTQEDFYGMASFFTEIQVRQDQERNLVLKSVGPNKAEVIKIIAVVSNITEKEAESLVDKRGPLLKEGTPRPKVEQLQAQLKKAGAETETRNMAQSFTVTDNVRPVRPVGKTGAGGGDLSIPDSKTGPVKSAFLIGKKGAESGTKRRETFAKHMTSKENLQFAKMAVNRVWAHFFGAGNVNPPDDFNERNKPTHPELLEALAKEFIANAFDVHWLIRSIAGSEAYNLTSRSKTRDANAEKYLALARVRALSPEQILRSVFEAAGAGDEGRRFMKDEQKRGMAISKIAADFRYAFGDDEGSEMVDFAGTITSALLMMNSQVMGQGTTVTRFNSLGEIIAKHPSPEEKIRAIFLSTVSRRPSDKELARWTAHVRRLPGNGGYEDVMWTLLNTSEFLFNH